MLRSKSSRAAPETSSAHQPDGVDRHEVRVERFWTVFVLVCVLVAAALWLMGITLDDITGYFTYGLGRG